MNPREHPKVREALDNLATDHETLCREYSDPEYPGHSRLVENCKREVEKSESALLAAVVEALEQERQKFQRETLRTSELSVMLLRFIQKHHDKGCRAERWPKSCDVCDLMLEGETLLAKPLNGPRVVHPDSGGWTVYGLPDDEGAGRYFSTEAEALSALALPEEK